MSLNKKTYSSGDVITSSNLNEIQDAIIVNENNISTINTNINSLNTKVDSLEYTVTTVTLKPTFNANAWVNNNGVIKQTVTCSGVTANSNIIVAPATSDTIYIQEYQRNNVVCIEQQTDRLVFQADSLPSSQILVNVLILGGS